MTNAIPRIGSGETIAARPLPLRPLPPSPQGMEACLRSFLDGFGLHFRPGESASSRCRLMTRVLQPEAGALPDAAMEILRDVAVVAEIAVETRLRALRNTCPPSVTWPPLDQGYQVAIEPTLLNATEKP